MCKSICSTSQTICLSWRWWGCIWVTSLTINKLIYILHCCCTKCLIHRLPSPICSLKIAHCAPHTSSSLTEGHYYGYGWSKILHSWIILWKFNAIPEHFIFTEIVTEVILGVLILLLILLAIWSLLFFCILIILYCLFHLASLIILVKFITIPTFCCISNNFNRVKAAHLLGIRIFLNLICRIDISQLKFLAFI